MMWWVVAAGAVLTALIIIFRQQIKEWPTAPVVIVGITILVVAFWPMAILFWQQTIWQAVARKQAKAMFVTGQAANAGK